MRTIVLLTASNIFMTFAWYGHLKFKDVALWKVILISWGIAFLEYCFMIPANRIGYGQFNAAQLKTIQEIITLTIFSIFSIFYLKEELRWNYAVGFLLIIAAAYFIFKKWWKKIYPADNSYPLTEIRSWKKNLWFKLDNQDLFIEKCLILQILSELKFIHILALWVKHLYIGNRRNQNGFQQ